MLKLHPNRCELLWSDTQAPLFTDFSGNISVCDWLQQLQSVISYCQQQNGQRVLLFQPDSYQFSLWFCALAHLGKQILLAPNNQPATMQALTQQTDWQTPAQLPAPVADPAIPAALSINTATQVIFFTSGSTGTPKLVNRRLSQLLLEVSTLEQHFGAALPANILFAATVSHQHIYGLLFRILWPLSCERRLYRPQLSYFEQWQALLQQHNMVLIASPAHLSRFEELPALTTYQHQLHAIFSSGGPLADHLPTYYRQHTGQTPYEIFGSTETGGIAYRQRQQADTCWQAFSNIALSQSADGCLLIRSPYVDEQADYQTQDLVRLLANNRFDLLGRADRIVKVEEKRLSLTELEKCCLQHPLITAAVALLLPQQPRQKLALVAVLTEQGRQQLQQLGHRAISQQIKQHLLTQFELVLLPKKFRYVAQLPYNEQGKLPQRQLESLFADG
ncbi:AMP-binding protein [Chromatiaceae bacterium AAb-1]|nr:AMP-binding protein [Chromatiaceae bacterium AAb-1]